MVPLCLPEETNTPGVCLAFPLRFCIAGDSCFPVKPHHICVRLFIGTACLKSSNHCACWGAVICVVQLNKLRALPCTGLQVGQGSRGCNPDLGALPYIR